MILISSIIRKEIIILESSKYYLMKMKKYQFTLCLLLLIFILAIQFVSADPVVLPIGPFELTILYILVYFFVFSITILIEYGVGFLLIRSRRIELKSMLKIILIINAITFPLTQIIGIIFYIYFLPIFIIEIFVIIVEWLLISLSYTKYRKSEFEDKLNPRILFLIYSLTANLLSFLIGVLLFINPYANFLGLLSF